METPHRTSSDGARCLSWSSAPAHPSSMSSAWQPRARARSGPEAAPGSPNRSIGSDAGDRPLHRGLERDLAVLQPHGPGRDRGVGQRVEAVLLLQRVHRRPEALVAIRDQLARRDQPAERLLDELLTLLEVVEDVVAEDQVAAVDPQGAVVHRPDVGDRPVGVRLEDVGGEARLDGEHARDLALALDALDARLERRVRDLVAVVGQEGLLALEMAADAPQPLADRRRPARVDERDPPVLDVALEQLDLAAALREDEVVLERLVVVEEVLLERVAVVAEAEDELRVAVVGVVLHEVQQDRLLSDRDERLGHARARLVEAQPQPAAEQHDLHGQDTSMIYGRSMPYL